MTQVNSNLSFVSRRDNSGKTIRMDIRRGHFCLWQGKDQQTQEFDIVKGRLIGISIRKCEVPSGETMFMDIHFTHGETRFDVSALASSSISAELISKLANIQDISSTIQIEVWPKGSFTNCVVRENGQKLPYRLLPKVERRQSGFKMTLDTAERDKAVMEMIAELNARLAVARSGGNSGQAD